MRSLDQPERAVQLASWAGTVVELGNKDAGRKLIEEAAEMTDRWKPSGRNSRAFGQIAVALAPHDAARAIRLLGKIAEKSERQGYQVQVAAAMGDLRQAEPLLKELEPEAAHRARLSLAYRIAPKRPAEAVAAGGESRRVTARRTRRRPAQFGRLAELIETHDPALACSLIDRVFAVYLPAVEAVEARRCGRRTRPPADHSGEAARLAVLARKVGHADMENVILPGARLAADARQGRFARPRDGVHRADGESLGDGRPGRRRSRCSRRSSGTARSLSDRAEWFQAWALADPQHAMELAERELAPRPARAGQARRVGGGPGDGRNLDHPAGPADANAATTA